MEQSYNFTELRINSGKVWSFVAIAITAGERQIEGLARCIATQREARLCLEKLERPADVEIVFQLPLFGGVQLTGVSLL